MTKRRASIFLLFLAVLFTVVYLYLPSRQTGEMYPGFGGFIDSPRPASQEDAKKLQATWEADATVTADFLTATTPTPDATATRNYLYTHMDEFVSPLATTTP